MSATSAIPLPTQKINLTQLQAVNDPDRGWMTALSGKRFRIIKVFEVYSYFPEADMHYCVEIRNLDETIDDNWLNHKGLECVWAKTDELKALLEPEPVEIKNAV